MSGGDNTISGDFKSTGSVLEKLSLFEKLDQRQVGAVTTATLAKSHSITSTDSSESPTSSVRRHEEMSKSMRSVEKDSGTVFAWENCIFVSIFNRC